MAQYQRKFGVIPCDVGAKFQFITPSRNGYYDYARIAETPSRNRDRNTLEFEKICMRFAYGLLKRETNFINIS